MASKRETIDSLLARHHNESVHTAHVTTAALTIFDAVAKRMGWTSRERRWLEAAGRLHDLGYAGAPANHIRNGAGRLRRVGIPGFSAAETRAVIAIMVLHGKGWERMPQSVWFRNLPQAGELQRLGAVLRVADATDHGHVQNTRVRRARVRKDVLLMELRTLGQPTHAARVAEKSELWRNVMPMPLRVLENVARSGSLYVPHMTPPLPGAEVARRLIFRQYRVLNDHIRLAQVEEDPIHLHDIRVAMRRFRATVRLFRAELTPTRAQELAERMRQLGTLLGPDRDADVWWHTLQGPDYVARLRRDAEGRRCLQRQRVRVRHARAHLRQVLDSESVRSLLLDMAALARVEIPEMLRHGESRDAGARMRRKLRRVARAILETRALPGREQVEELHELRRRCRLARYWAEFAVPVSAPPMAELADRLKLLADVLGRVHDLDMALERIAADRRAPAWITRRLRQERQAAYGDAVMVWERVQRKKQRAALRRALL